MARCPDGRVGLTLVELLVVLAMIVIFSGLIVPTFRSMLATSRLNSAARGIFAQCQFARDMAIRRDTYARVIIDTDAGTYGVLVLSKPEDERREREWEEPGSSLGFTRRLPDGVEFDRVISGAESGDEMVTFSPDGRGEDWFVSLRDSRDQAVLVHVTGTTGMVEVLTDQDEEQLARIEAMMEEP